MRMQIVSDVHLEFRKGRYPHIARLAPYIALLGDIGKPFSNVYERFLRDLSRRFERVIVLAGNHEFWCSLRKIKTVAEIKERIAEVCGKFPNVHFLDDRAMFLDGVRILGSTLWTYVPPDLYGVGRKRMNDYHVCFVQRLQNHDSLGVPLAPEHTSFWHEQSVRWLKEELAAPGYANTPTIILSHHAPSTHHTSPPEFDNHVQNCFYATDLTPMFAPPIVAWAYGHTHYPHDNLVRGVRLVSNPVGYPGELAGESAALTTPPVIFSSGRA